MTIITLLRQYVKPYMHANNNISYYVHTYMNYKIFLESFSIFI